MAKLNHLKFNDPAPDLVLLDTEGIPVRLSSLWQERVLLLAFTRHFGCPQCKEMADVLSAVKPDLDAHKIGLVVVTQGTVQAADAFCAQRLPGVKCLADPERKAYAAYGLGRANVFESIFSVNVFRSNRRLEKQKGWKPEVPPAGQDAFLMSGTFIIGLDGKIRLPYYYDDIADHPSVELLLGGVMGMDWSAPLNSPIDPE